MIFIPSYVQVPHTHVHNDAVFFSSVLVQFQFFFSFFSSVFVQFSIFFKDSEIFLFYIRAKISANFFELLQFIILFRMNSEYVKISTFLN